MNQVTFNSLRRVLLCLAPSALVLLSQAVPTLAHETLSNRHHLNCTAIGEPVVIPHTTHSTGPAYLPADLGAQGSVTQLYGDESQTQLGLNRRGIIVNEESRGVVLVPAPHGPTC